MKNTILTIALAITSVFAVAQTNADVVGEWYNAEKDAVITLFEDGSTISGKITWIVSSGKNILEIKISDGLFLGNKLSLKALGELSPNSTVADISTTFDSIDLNDNSLLFNESVC